jgi:hypothetical protein
MRLAGPVGKTPRRRLTLIILEKNQNGAAGGWTRPAGGRVPAIPGGMPPIEPMFRYDEGPAGDFARDRPRVAGSVPLKIISRFRLDRFIRFDYFPANEFLMRATDSCCPKQPQASGSSRLCVSNTVAVRT